MTTPVRVTRPATNSLSVTVPRALVDSVAGYRWFATTVDGHAQDFAPDRGGVLHDLTAPTIALTPLPALSTHVSTGLSVPVEFSVADRGGSGLDQWGLECRVTVATRWTRYRTGTSAGPKIVTSRERKGRRTGFGSSLATSRAITR